MRKVLVLFQRRARIKCKIKNKSINFKIIEMKNDSYGIKHRWKQSAAIIGAKAILSIVNWDWVHTVGAR